MKIKIAHVTTSRSDYGPCYWFLHEMFSCKMFDVKLLVGGAHLEQAFGNSVSEIESDGWPIAARLPYLAGLREGGQHALAASKALIMFARQLEEIRPDLMVIYGDRYELLPIATAAVITRIPMVHFCGGDVTIGAFDEQVRHALTKMAHIHFPSTKRSAERLLQMGEEPWRVHNIGDPAIDRFVRGACSEPKEIAELLGFEPNRMTILVSFHPPTLAEESVYTQVKELVAALEEYDGSIVITSPAPDPGSEIIRNALMNFAKKRDNAVFVANLGSNRYRGLMKVAGAMVGNSSSGIIEAPCVPLPVVNIGDRQNGRERASNVIDVAPKKQEILAALRVALGEGFRSVAAKMPNPYGKGDAARDAVRILLNLPAKQKLLEKKFCELPWRELPGGGL